MRSRAIPRRCSVAVNFTLYATSAVSMEAKIKTARSRSNFICQGPRRRSSLDPARNPVPTAAACGFTATPDEVKHVVQGRRSLAAGLEVENAPSARNLEDIVRPEIPVLRPRWQDDGTESSGKLPGH